MHGVNKEVKKKKKKKKKKDLLSKLGVAFTRNGLADGEVDDNIQPPLQRRHIKMLNEILIETETNMPWKHC